MNAENHRVDRASQAFRTRRSAPSDSVATDEASFKVFCAGIRDPEISAALVEALQNQSIAASRVSFVGYEASAEVYSLSFFVRNPFDGQEHLTLQFLGLYTPSDDHVTFFRE